MHSYKAIDCATDSFKTTTTVPEGDRLGELKLESEGLLLLIKPKLYVMFSKEVQIRVEAEGDLREYLKKNIDSLRVGEDIVKFALHGFWGDPKQLLELYVEKGNEYIVDHMVKIKETFRQGKQPMVMETQRRHLKVDWSKEIRPCGLSMNEALNKMEEHWFAAIKNQDRIRVFSNKLLQKFYVVGDFVWNLIVYSKVSEVGVHVFT